MKRAAYITILLLLSGIALWGQIKLMPGPGPLGDGIVGTGYEGTTIVPYGCGQAGENACTWSVSSGTLPPGLALAPGCLAGSCWLGFTGTPTTGGTFTFTIKADSINVNNLPITGSETYTIVIFAMSVPAAVSWVEGVPVNQEFSVEYSDPSIASYQWALAAGTLPPGLLCPPLTLSLLSYPALAIYGTPTTPGVYPMTIQLIVNDNLAGTLTETQTFNVAIASSAPTAATAPGNLTLGVPVATNLGAAGGFGAGTYTFSYSGTLPPGLTLSTGGSLTGTPTTVGVFGFTVQLASALAGYPPLTASVPFTMTVYPTFAITALPASTATVGTAYSQPFTATGGGGASTYTWTLTGGSLPPGLTLAPTGVLGGTPTATGTFSGVIQVTSQVPAVGAMTAATGFTITVTGAAAPTITGSLPNGSVGTPYSAALGATGGYGVGTYTFAVTSGVVPGGTTLSAAGVLSGTPTAQGSFSFTVQVTSTDANPNAGLPPVTATEAFTVLINPPLAIVTPLSGLGSGVVGTPYAATLAATGGYGAGTYTFAVTSGAVPTGTTLSAAGALSGTPAAAGTFAFTVQVTSTYTNPNAGLAPVTASGTFTIAVAASASVAIAGSLGNGVVGAPYSASLTATGGYGAGSYTFAVTSGAVPTGTTLSAGGALSGTPTAAGSFSFTVQATSTYANPNAGLPPVTATQSFTIAIYPALAISTTAASAGTVGTAYSQTFAATGGAGNYAWTATASTLPPGLTLSAAGVLSGTPTTPGTYPLAVQVSSAVPSVGTLTASATFKVAIATTATFVVTGSLGNGVVGTPYSAALGATGGYGAGTYTFAVLSGPVPTGTALSAAGALSGTPTAAGSFAFTVQATSTYANPNAGLSPLTATEAFTVVIYPALTITTTAASSGTVGTAYSQTFAASGGAGASSYTWSVPGGTLPPGLTFSAAGVLSGAPTAAGSFAFTVQVSSAIPTVGTQTASAAFNVAIAPAPPVAITGSLGNGVVGAPYSRTLGATGGYTTGTYTFSVTSGAVPTGMTLSAAGAFSGTPTAAGSFAFTVQVTSTSSSLTASLPPVTATQAFTIVIYPALAISTTAASAGTVGTAYSQTFGASGGAGASSYTWSVLSGTVPPGLTLSPAGVLGGTPTTAGTFAFTIQVSSVIPTVGTQTASAAFNVVIAAALPPLTIIGSLGNGIVGTPYSATLGTTGGYGVGTYTFSVTSGAVPTGTALSAAGALSGTPTAAGSFAFTVQVTNQATYSEVRLATLTATQAFTIVIYPALAITTTAASAGTVGTAYSQTFAATGGAGASSYTWSAPMTSGTASSGTPPPGLIFSAGGVLSGTPTAAGTFAFVVQVASVIPGFGTQTTSAEFNVVIAAALPPLTITGSLAGGMVGTPYSATLGATGGYPTGTYAFSVTSGAVPTGTALSSAGTLSGTPTAAGSFTFTVQLADTNSSVTASFPTLTATQAFTIAIYPALAITPQTLDPATVGAAYAVTFQPTGGYGSGSYSYTLTAGALPPGILLVSGTLSGTPTAAGTFSFTLQIANAPIAGAANLSTFTATQPFTFVVGLPAAPPVTISGLPASPAPATQPVLGLSAGTAYPLDIQGTIALGFAPTSGADDPNVQFTTGGRTVTFQIPAGSTAAQFAGSTPGVQTGTVAGTITLTLDLTAAGTDITPTPAPTQVLVVAPSAPVITSAVVTPVSGGFNLAVIGYATTRDMTSAAIVFTPAAGVTLASTTASVSLSPLFTTWYQNAASAQYGSQFSLTIPFTVQNSTAPITSLSVTLTNSQGSSAAATAAY